MSKEKIFLFLSCLVLTACEYDPAPPAGDLPFFAYSIDEEFEDHLFDAVNILNAAAGCELVGVMPDEAYVLPIVIVDDDYFENPFVVGRAKVTSAFGHTERKHPIRIEVRAMHGNWPSIYLAHEMGHTLGLHHSDEGVMSAFAGIATEEFNQHGKDHLSDLCRFVD